MKLSSRYQPEHYIDAKKWARKCSLSMVNKVLDNFCDERQDLISRFSFVCGCGHSGTSLMASKIGLHSEVFFVGRETHLFAPSNGSHCIKRRLLDWDHFAYASRRTLVLEKTPKHVQSIKRIKRFVPAARIIVMVRNPLDNVSSLYKRLGDLNAATKRWIIDNTAACDLSELSHVQTIMFEDFTRNPNDKLAEVFNFLKLDTTKISTNDINEVYIRSSEIHKKLEERARQVSAPISVNEGKWKSILSPQQVSIVIKETREVARQLGYENFDY
jgi:hypothetical protein